MGREHILSETQYAKRRLKIELHQTEKEFKKQLMSIESKIEKAKALETRVDKKAHEMATNSGNALERHLALSRKRYSDLKRRNALEMEGYSQEAMFLRTRLKHIEKHISQQRHQLQNQNQLERHSLDEEPFLSVPPPPPPTLSARPTILSPRAKSDGGSSGVRRSF